jgi:DNA-directed RNA polymerase specialized sigma24 family protein
MEVGLTAKAFAKLLDRLGADREEAGEKYEDLRRTLTRFFEWRGAPFPEEHTDETFNRVARRLDEGVQIKNLGGYSYEVARLVFLETTKGHDSKRASLESIRFQAAESFADEFAEKELRLACLEDCLRGLPSDRAELILEYYGYDKRVQIEQRRALAKRFDLRRDALANRAQRVRDNLHQCVRDCLRRKSAI